MQKAKKIQVTNKNSIFATTKLNSIIMSAELIQLNIPLNFDQLLELVKQLSPKEKLKLESMIWNETDEENIEISALQKKIVNERLQTMNNNPEDCKNWEEIECNLNI